MAFPTSLGFEILAYPDRGAVSDDGHGILAAGNADGTDRVPAVLVVKADAFHNAHDFLDFAIYLNGRRRWFSGESDHEKR